MSDTPTHDDHWRRLASELGLDVGPEPEQPPPATEPEMRAAEPDTERPRSHRRPEPPDDEPVEAAQEPFEPAEPEPPARGRRGRVTAAEEETSLFEAETVPPAEAEIEGSDVEAAAVP